MRWTAPRGVSSSGTGHAINVMARHYPQSTFVEYDINETAITAARTEAVDYGLSNASFETLDVARLPAQPPC